MWNWIITLPLFWQIALPVFTLIVILIIAIYGQLVFTWGKHKIGLGGKKKRLCIDCSMLHRAESAKVNRKLLMIETTVMRDKMNFVEHKLLELRRSLYKEASNRFKDDGANDNDLASLI